MIQARGQRKAILGNGFDQCVQQCLMPDFLHPVHPGIRCRIRTQASQIQQGFSRLDRPGQGFAAITQTMRLPNNFLPGLRTHAKRLPRSRTLRLLRKHQRYQSLGNPGRGSHIFLGNSHVNFSDNINNTKGVKRFSGSGNECRTNGGSSKGTKRVCFALRMRLRIRLIPGITKRRRGTPFGAADPENS